MTVYLKPNKIFVRLITQPNRLTHFCQLIKSHKSNAQPAVIMPSKFHIWRSQLYGSLAGNPFKCCTANNYL